MSDLDLLRSALSRGETRVRRLTTDADDEAGWRADLTIMALTLVTSLAITALALGVASPRTPLRIIITIVMVAPLAMRRHYPLAMLLITSFGGLLHLGWSASPLPCLGAVPLAVFSVARFVPDRTSRWAPAVGTLASVLGPISWAQRSLGWGVNSLVLAILVCFGMVVTPYIMGRRLRESELAKIRHEEALAERHRIELADREQAARMAEVNARQQIARELHDIVAHSLSVMIVQAEGGRALATKKPERAVEALSTIASTGREALDEMRRIVGVLRSGDDSPAYAPMPGFSDIPALVALTGDRVRLAVHGTPQPASPAIQLTVYRIVQEAITNMLKHAGPGACAEVTLDHRPGQVSVAIVDDGVGVPDTFDGRGNGLKGMGERVAAMGGTLTTGPEPAAGFGVRATIPLPHPARTERTTA